MSDLEQQLRRYSDWAVDKVEPVSADSIMAAKPHSKRPGRPRRTLVLAATTLVLAATAGIAFNLNQDTPVSIPLVRTSSLVAVRVSKTFPLTATSSPSSWGPPESMSVGDGAVWITEGGQSPPSAPPPPTAVGGVLRLDPATLALTAWAAVAAPAGAGASAGSVWVAGFTNNKVTRIDTSTGAVLATVTLTPTPGPSPTGPSFSDGVFLANGIAADANAVWVTSGRGYVAEIDPRTNRVVEEYQLSPGSPLQVAVSGDVGWLAAGEQGVAMLQPSVNVPKVVPVVIGGRQTSVSAVTVYQGQVWIAGSILVPDAPDRFTYSGESFVGVVNSTTGKLIATATTNLQYPMLAATSNGLWVTDGKHIISSVGLDSNGAIKITPTARLNETHAAFSVVGAGAYIWIIDGVDPVMKRVDPRSGVETPILLP